MTVVIEQFVKLIQFSCGLFIKVANILKLLEKWIELFDTDQVVKLSLSAHVEAIRCRLVVQHFVNKVFDGVKFIRSNLGVEFRMDDTHESVDHLVAFLLQTYTLVGLLVLSLISLGMHNILVVVSVAHKTFLNIWFIIFSQVLFLWLVHFVLWLFGFFHLLLIWDLLELFLYCIDRRHGFQNLYVRGLNSFELVFKIFWDRVIKWVHNLFALTGHLLLPVNQGKKLVISSQGLFDVIFESGGRSNQFLKNQFQHFLHFSVLLSSTDILLLFLVFIEWIGKWVFLWLKWLSSLPQVHVVLHHLLFEDHLWEILSKVLLADCDGVISASRVVLVSLYDLVLLFLLFILRVVVVAGLWLFGCNFFID